MQHQQVILIKWAVAEITGVRPFLLNGCRGVRHLSYQIHYLLVRRCHGIRCLEHNALWSHVNSPSPSPSPGDRVNVDHLPVVAGNRRQFRLRIWRIGRPVLLAGDASCISGIRRDRVTRRRLATHRGQCGEGLVRHAFGWRWSQDAAERVRKQKR